MTRHAYWLLFVIGCASPMSAMRDDNRRLNTTVSELRADRRTQERKVRDLQHQLDKLRATQVSAVMAALPPLPVEVAAPPSASAPSDGSRVVAITEDGTEIVYEGDAAAGKSAMLDEETPAPRRARPLPPVIEISSGDRADTRRMPPVSARTARVTTREREAAPERSDDAGVEYRAAVELVKGGNHADAITGLRGFLRRFPRHDYADNAQYWLGEAFYAQKDYPHALGEFRNVIETYPRGNKVPDALLKVGYCYHALGQAEKAKAVLEQVVNLYPKTEPAALAAKRLGDGAMGESQ
ncbi:MAG: tol-pal system protein YbgF [Deltaproteobacteria bacterium]|nr:tol-pal system protein YbgF [Deltaproteobacteria bacterium]